MGVFERVLKAALILTGLHNETVSNPLQQAQSPEEVDKQFKTIVRKISKIIETYDNPHQSELTYNLVPVYYNLSDPEDHKLYREELAQRMEYWYKSIREGTYNFPELKSRSAYEIEAEHEFDNLEIDSQKNATTFFAMSQCLTTDGPEFSKPQDVCLRI